ncbi:MAG TPA: helix-turn-helix domain-containing protein [Acidimicrobiales bacterium]|nr:helix-turn-helix domain-containing protein [Acidimicrobiales bacterium]
MAVPNRVGGIVDAALEVFGRLGYSRAQMADVAEAAGVSVGTLYNYVEGKEALLLLCALYAFDPDEATRGPKPLTVASRPRFLAQLRQALDDITQLPALDAALARQGPPAHFVEECTRIVEELFDLIGDHRRGLDALERSARDMPDVAALFYDNVRRGLLRDLTTYVARRAPQLDAAVTARWIVESITWMARHRFGDPDGGRLDAEAVRATTVELITRAISGGTA